MSESTSRHILLVDDNDVLRHFVADEFHYAGFDVTQAANSIEALKLISGSLAFDVLITDIRMPGLDGWSLAELARELRPQLAVLYVSGWSDVAPRPVPGSSFVNKPFSAVQLIEAVQTLLQSSAEIAVARVIRK